MGLFDRKTPASHGLLALAIGAQTTIITELGFNRDSEMLCAYFGAHIQGYSKVVGASGDILDRFIENCYAGLVEITPLARGRFVPFGLAFGGALKSIDAAGLTNGWADFYHRFEGLYEWSMSKGELDIWVGTMERAVFAMLQEQKCGWKPN